MRVVHRQIYLGPSVFSPQPHVRLFLALDAGERVPDADGARVARRLRRFFPADAVAAIGTVAAATPMPSALAFLARALIRSTGADVRLGEAIEVSPRTWHVAVGMEEPSIAGTAALLAVALVEDRPDDDCEAAVRAFRVAVERCALPAAVRLQWGAARRRGIPGHMPSSLAGMVVLGQGCRQRRIAGMAGSRTPAIAHALAADRAVANDLLGRAGFALVPAAAVASPAAADEAARQLGFPLVLFTRRPGGARTGDTPVIDVAMLRAAFDRAAAAGPVFLEHPGPGDVLHFAIVDGRVAAVARQGAEGWRDVTATVHAGHRRTAEAAARAIGLDVAGVRAVVPDPAGGPAAGAMRVAAVDAEPGVVLHRGAGPRDVAAALVASLFPPGTDGRIPIAAITGTNGKTTTARMVARIMRASGRVTGLADTSGVEVDGATVARGDLAGPAGARIAIEHPLVEVAVLEAARGGLLRQGLGFDRCTVAAVLNVGDDHVGTDGIRDRADLARIKGLVTTVATDLVVLGAGDPLCVGLRGGSPAARACFVSLDPAHPLVCGGRAAGDVAVTVVGDGGAARVVLRDDAGETALAAVAGIPAADGGRARHNLENALFAAAVAHGLGASPAAIAEGLAAYDLSYAASLGRLAISDARPFRVVVDYGHNAAAVAAMRAYAAACPVAGRRICMLNAPGNRIDGHYAALAAVAAGGFDHYVCTGPAEPRGRAPGEVARRIADELRAAGVPAGRIVVVPDEAAAVPVALAAAGPGDLVLLFSHDPERCWRQVDAG